MKEIGRDNRMDKTKKYQDWIEKTTSCFFGRHKRCSETKKWCGCECHKEVVE